MMLLCAELAEDTLGGKTVKSIGLKESVISNKHDYHISGRARLILYQISDLS